MLLGVSLNSISALRVLAAQRVLGVSKKVLMDYTPDALGCQLVHTESVKGLLRFRQSLTHTRHAEIQNTIT
jgi:hypothetical protein